MEKMQSAWLDLREGARRHELVRFLSLDDIRQRYARTLLGPFWLVIGAALWIAALSFLAGVLFKADLRTFFPYVAIGMITWIHFQSLIVDGTIMPVQNAFFISNINVPFSVHIYRFVVRDLALFAHYLPIIIGVLLLIPGNKFGPGALLALPGLALITLFAAGLGVFLGFYATRYRDLHQLVVASMQVLPPLTPIVWEKRFLPERFHALADLNPLYHLINVFRNPLMGRPVPPESWMFSAIAAAVALLLAFWAFARYRRKCVYWL
jgi:ABC-2 type transport system permease protein